MDEASLEREIENMLDTITEEFDNVGKYTQAESAEAYSAVADDLRDRARMLQEEIEANEET